jgi:hypothetical protein
LVLKRRAFIPAIWIVILIFSSLTVWADMIVDTAWVRRYNGPGNVYDWANDIVVDDSGDVYVTGISINSITSYDFVTIK